MVLSRSSDPIEGAEVIHDYQEFIEKYKQEHPIGCLWIIGGEEIYRLTLPYWDELYLTVVHDKSEGDTFFPKFEKEFTLVEDEPCGNISFRKYVRL